MIKEDSSNVGVKAVNNATARVMTNKKMVSPYSNGEALTSLPYGNPSPGRAHATPHY
ncbi:hypothetical protein JZ751_025232 [Albula glossodonta]|uniref:Uncharacterized protein n=1 Tax=Albula glossodonta TaxID=121402 RepID=A0A8T2NEL5_9TELE|nr:hypothetical protein JZ751_025232 [Albula glossodonta]